MRFLLKAVPIVALVGIFASQAVAQTPPTQCATGRNLTQYNAGLITGVSLTNSAFASTKVAGDCGNFDLFKSEVVRVFKLVLSQIPKPASQAVQCRFLGEYQAVLNQVAAIEADCKLKCAMDGKFVGEMAAALYCDLSISLGGLGLDVNLGDGPATTCGNAFEPACQASFLDETSVAKAPDCKLYTKGTSFNAVWVQTQSNQCLWDPQEPTDE